METGVSNLGEVTYNLTQVLNLHSSANYDVYSSGTSIEQQPSCTPRYGSLHR